MNYSIGIDIGTTTICGVLTSEQTKEVVSQVTKANDTFLPSENFEKLQSPERIYEIVFDIITSFFSSVKAEDSITTIGFTGQMHGIVYIDENGNAVSPLFNWQDERGNRIYKNQTTYAEFIKNTTLRPASTGFGLVTHFYNAVNNLIPQTAKKICTIHSYIAMRLTGAREPVLHASDAASLGLYDAEKNAFDENALSQLGISCDILPRSTTETECIGEYSRSNVFVAIGDNQASFLGSVNSSSDVLVNVGTASQVSLRIDTYRPSDTMEIRPYLNGSYLLVGSALCGGYSYNLLKKFYEKVFAMCKVTPPENMYQMMNLEALAAYGSVEDLEVSTQFRGTRSDTSIRGHIKNIGVENFTPAELNLGIMRGMAKELFDIVHDELPSEFCLVGAGNGVRKNSLLQKLFEDIFKTTLSLPKYEEEAAYGASIFPL